MKRGLFIALAVVVAAVVVLLLFTYEIIAIDWLGFMEDQPSIRYQEGPRRQSPEDAVSFYQPAYHDQALAMTNPVPDDAVSLQRGGILFGLHCSVCHGPGGQADGPVTKFWKADARRPANLTATNVGEFPDGLLYQVITQGLGGMPPMRESFTERQVWDVINHVRTLSKASP